MNESHEITLTFSDGESSDVLVSDLGNNRFRVDDPLVAWFSEDVRYGTVIEVLPRDDGDHLFVRVVEASPYRCVEYVIGSNVVRSPEVVGLLGRVVDEGGNWEYAMGLLCVALAPGSMPHFEVELDHLQRRHHASGGTRNDT